ncbi:hypothetical protein HN51_059104, partial [Arachis hypogaea]
EVAKKSLEKAAECVRCLEEDMAKARERVKGAKGADAILSFEKFCCNLPRSLLQ